ncbi:hypothetical protein Droror1_Dr00028258, partial [Drosera rotundifolia]
LERMKKLQAQKGRAGGLPVNQPRSWSQLGSFEAHPALMLVITAPIGEVSRKMQYGMRWTLRKVGSF